MRKLCLQWHWMSITFSNIEANSTKTWVKFPKKLSGTKLMWYVIVQVAWRLHGSHTLTDMFMAFFFRLKTFEPIFGRFLSFWNSPEVKDGGTSWPPFRNYYAMFTSCDNIASGCGPPRRHFRHTIHCESRCNSFEILGITEQGRNPVWIGLMSLIFDYIPSWCINKYFILYMITVVMTQQFCQSCCWTGRNKAGKCSVVCPLSWFSFSVLFD